MRYLTSKGVALGAALVLALSACDLEVINPNAPDRGRALASAGDVETLIQGSFGQWWQSSHVTGSPVFNLANKSFQMSAWPANFGMFFYSQLSPRQPIVNDPTHQFYGNMVNGLWFRNYRCLSAVAQGLQSLEDPEIASQLTATQVLRAQTFGKLMQGLCHGALAMFHQEAWIIDEDTEITDESGIPLNLDPAPYTEVMAAALGYFDDAIALASQGGFSFPASWMSREITAAELIPVIHSMKARHRANVARTPAERAAVNWQAVIDDVDAGVQDTWNLTLQVFSAPFWNEIISYATLSFIGWNQTSYMIEGMADQSGRYEEWLATMAGGNPETRHPDLPSGPFVIETPDLRFPQGATLAEQKENPGTLRDADGGPFFDSNNWGQAARGTHRWSYYRPSHLDFHYLFGGTSVPEITIAEMNLLKAEGLLRLGQEQEAADIINITRTAAGLSAADPTAANDGNDSCVPRIPAPSLNPADATCGDLMEMLKWEKRMETAFLGVYANSWYFDGRGWGDLWSGTALELPVPCQDMEVMSPPRACTTTGGVGGPSASPASIYPIEP